MRRAIPLLILVVVSVVIAACSISTAPKQDEPCRSGYIGPGGRCLEDSTGVDP